MEPIFEEGEEGEKTCPDVIAARSYMHSSHHISQENNN